MIKEKPNYKYIENPIPITDQVWPDGTEPLVATSTLTFNHASYIRECLEGILMQCTTFPVKICIFEDCSEDGTQDILREYMTQYPHLFEISFQPQNTHKKPTRKKAFEAFKATRAPAKYVALCEGDDYWTDPLKLQKQIEFLEGNPSYSMCFHKASVIGSEAEKRIHLFDHLLPKDYTGEEILVKWTVPTASVVFNRILINHSYISHPDFIFGDIILFLNLAEKGKIRCIDGEMSAYRVHNKGISMQWSITSSLKFIKHHIAIQNSFGGKYKYITDPIISKSYKDIFLYYLKKGQTIRSLPHLFSFMSYQFRGSLSRKFRYKAYR